MKTSGAATTLAALYANDPISVERTFQHLTAPTLANLDRTMCLDGNKNHRNPEENYHVVAQACIRRTVHKQLDKYSTIASKEEVEAALKYHHLPESLRADLSVQYGGHPTSWWDALQQLNEISENQMHRLWELILDHPMTAYVPMQCQKCGNVVADVHSSNKGDVEVGLSEVEPNELSEECLQLRGGWFRGRPRGAKVLKLNCCKCSAVSYWYRSSHPRVILNPNKWGRLCGEQEDLRLALANYLGIPVRTCIPLDWDHIWSEYGVNTAGTQEWRVRDDSCRNFAARLDEGIGSWTRVLSIHPDPKLCFDVTEDYLSCCHGPNSLPHQCTPGGRADICHSKEMPRYRGLVEDARSDANGHTTQAKTVVGYAIHRANFQADEITAEMQRAAREYGTKAWWQVT